MPAKPANSAGWRIAQGTGPAEEAGETRNAQYVMCLGANDEDTQKPVFEQAEAMQRAWEILIRHFGGQIDDGADYQEWTLLAHVRQRIRQEWRRKDFISMRRPLATCVPSRSAIIHLPRMSDSFINARKGTA